MILYFTGTGNSRYAARQLGKVLEDEVYPIQGDLKANREGVFDSQRPYVFVSPTYAWRLPRVVEEYIIQSRFEGSRMAYFILTCGDSVGAAAEYAAALCRKKGLEFRGLGEVVMPENYIAMFPVPPAEEAAQICNAAEPVLAELAELIREGKSIPSPKAGILGKMESGPVNRLFYPLFVSAGGFWSTDTCVGCGLCQEQCPLNNIRLKEGRPVWGSHCTHCMACICGCPHEAIEYKKRSKGQPRYYLK